jgi:hypothetical protein
MTGYDRAANMYVVCQCHARNANLILCLNACGAKKMSKTNRREDFLIQIAGAGRQAAQ